MGWKDEEQAALVELCFPGCSNGDAGGAEGGEADSAHEDGGVEVVCGGRLAPGVAAGRRAEGEGFGEGIRDWGLVWGGIVEVERHLDSWGKAPWN